MAEVRFTRYSSQPPAAQNVLLVDDNDRYAKTITEDLQKRGAEVTRARSAAEGIDLLNNILNSFDGIVTDISMESQVSGLKVLKEAKKLKFSGFVAVATTGLDTQVGFIFNRFVLGVIYKSNYLIPKRPIKRDGNVIWIKVKG